VRTLLAEIKTYFNIRN